MNCRATQISFDLIQEYILLPALACPAQKDSPVMQILNYHFFRN